jgi:prophage antirepressor-like protein
MIMEKEVTIFTYQGKDVGGIRDLNGEPWWVGRDICTYFGRKDYERRLSMLAEDEKMLVSIKDSAARVQKVTVVNEPGLYMLLLGFLPENTHLTEGAESEAHLIECIKKIVNFKIWMISKAFPSTLNTGSSPMATLETNRDATKASLEEIDKREPEDKPLADTDAVKKEFLESLANAGMANIPTEWIRTDLVNTAAGVQKMAMLSEHGLYYLAARLGTPKALSFLRWCAREVFPGLRKTRRHSMTSPQKYPDTLGASADEVAGREQAMREFALAEPKKGAPVLLH